MYTNTNWTLLLKYTAHSPIRCPSPEVRQAPSQICESHRAGALSWNLRGGGTELEFESLKGPPHRSVRTTGRGHWAGIHGAGALNLGMRCHKDTPFDHISLLISTNQKPGFLALDQWEAMILQKFMSTFQTKTGLTSL